jgi:glycosyltransferase involved in cell wall biosynthesis
MATRNRDRILRDVLEAFCRLQQPSSGWQLIIVDNDSTDDTTQVIASFANRLPLQTVHERELGQTRARNRGLELVKGDLTIFTDDDIFPCTEWLVKLKEAADSQPAYSMFGGPIVARWETPPPYWVRWIDIPGAVYGITDRSLEDGPTNPWELFGGNMAIRTSVFRTGTRFVTSMGPRGSNYPIGGETELLMRLARQGHKAWHVKGALVEHFVQKKHLKQTWVMRRALRFGRGSYRIHSMQNNKVHTRLYLLRAVLKAGLDMTKAGVSFRQEALFRSRWRLNFARGQATEARIWSRQTGKTVPIKLWESLAVAVRVEDFGEGGVARIKLAVHPGQETKRIFVHFIPVTSTPLCRFFIGDHEVRDPASAKTSCFISAEDMAMLKMASYIVRVGAERIDGTHAWERNVLTRARRSRHDQDYAESIGQCHHD